MNVIPAWKEGVTGEGVVVTILDDGLESDHPDLVENFVSIFCYHKFGKLSFFLFVRLIEVSAHSENVPQKTYFSSSEFIIWPVLHQIPKFK